MVSNDLEQLYIKYHRELLLYAFSLCKDYHRAEDLVSDTFFKAVLSLDLDSTYIKFWLFRVCKNLFIDQVRQKKNFTSLNSFDDIEISEETPLDKLIENEENKHLYKLVMNLRPSYREVIILFYYLDFSLKEIAAATGLKDNNVRVLLFRARKKLKILLEGGK